jgi:hypothetical protein
MAQRAAVFEGFQIAPEVTPGTQVAASKRILAWDIDVDPIEPTELVRPQGQKVATGMVLGKPHTEASIKGALCYNSVNYLLSSILQAATISTPSQNGVFTVTLGAPSAGTFTLTFNGQTTSALAYTATGATVQTALLLLSTVGAGNATVTGGAGGPYTVTLAGALLGSQLAVTGSGAGLTGGTFGITTTAASAARRWLYNLTQSDVDTLKSYTIQKGSSVNAASFGYAQATDMEWNFSRTTVGLTAKMLGQILTDGITMTSTPTDIALQPVSVPEISVWAGTSVLGLARLDNVQTCKVGWKDRVKPAFYLDDQQTSYTAPVENELDMMATLKVMQNTAANAYLTALRAKTYGYLRIMMVGQNIESGYPYRIRLTTPYQVRNPKRGESESVYTGDYDFQFVYNAAGVGIEVVVDCALTAL